MIRIHEQDYAHLKTLTLSERQRLLGVCAELTLYGHSSYLAPTARTGAPSGWARVADLSDSPHLTHAMSWWWRRSGEGQVLLCRSGEPPELTSLESLRELNPLPLLIRSPEQATLRRLLLTEGAEVTLVDAPWGCGLSWGLALAIADRLQEIDGELLFISREPQVARELIDAVSPGASSRLHVVRFEEAYERCFGSAPHPDPLSVMELSTKVHEISSRVPQHPWGELLPLLNLLLEHPEARQQALSSLEPLWAESAGELLKQLEAMSQPQAPLDTRAPEWPWPALSCVVVDDALAYAEGPLRELLSLAHNTLSDRRRGWRLMLAGRELGYPSALSPRWRPLEEFCRSELGKHTLRHQMTQSERLTQGRRSLISALGERDPRAWVERPRRQGALELSHKPKHYEPGALVGFHWTERPLTEDQQRALCRSTLGTPGGCIFDFSPQQTLLRCAAELTGDSGERPVPIYAGHKQLGGEARSIGEPSTIIAYAPFGLIGSAPLRDGLPSSLSELVLALEAQLLRALLSRSGGRLYLIGELSEPLRSTLGGSEYSVYLSSIHELTTRVDAESPWGGGWASDQRDEARGLMSTRDWSGALERWRATLPVARAVFGASGHREVLSSLQALHSAAFTEGLKAQAWRQAAALARATPAGLSLSLDEDQSLTLKAGVRALNAEAEEALHKADLPQLERALSRLDGLGELEVARPLYLSSLRRLWELSASHLEAPVPQGPVQVLFMRHLASQEPDQVEYQCLLQAYEQRPEARALCSLARVVLSQPDTLCTRWALRHLLRWAKHLDRGLSELVTAPPLSFELAPQAQRDPEERLFSAQLTILFAIISTRVDEWVLSKQLIHEALESPERSTLLAHLQPPSQPSPLAPEGLTQLSEALLTSWERQGAQERQRALRVLGDLKGLEDSYQAYEAPPHLEATFELRRALERARGLWRCLTPNERAHLERAWESVQLASPNPRWGVESLAPLDEALPPERRSGEGEA